MTDATGRNAALRQMLTARWRDIQGDSDVSQTSAETLMLIDEALFLLDAGEYGFCVDCGGEIAEQQLEALPFAMRCRTCDDRRGGQHEPNRSPGDAADSLFGIALEGGTR